ncbi:hypothetical protein PTKIN_Ptkin03bG0127500 [Pterospermum kingtungense]
MDYSKLGLADLSGSANLFDVPIGGLSVGIATQQVQNKGKRPKKEDKTSPAEKVSMLVVQKKRSSTKLDELVLVKKAKDGMENRGLSKTFKQWKPVKAAPSIIMNLLAWNCQGLGVPRTVRELTKLVLHFKPQVLFFSETKKNSSCMERLRVKWDFDSCLTVDCRGRVDG